MQVILPKFRFNLLPKFRLNLLKFAQSNFLLEDAATSPAFPSSSVLLLWVVLLLV